MSVKSLCWIAPVALVAPFAKATVYATPEAAVSLIFPDLKEPGAGAFTAFTLSDEEREAVKKLSGLRVRDVERSVWTAPDGRKVYVDRVIGKHEYITIAVGVDAKGVSAGVEILEYKETYGGEVRRKEWREKLKGKTVGEAFRLDRDVPNITGATLSSRSVSEGVKRVLAIRAATKH